MSEVLSSNCNYVNRLRKENKLSIKNMLNLKNLF